MHDFQHQWKRAGQTYSIDGSALLLDPTGDMIPLDLSKLGLNFPLRLKQFGIVLVTDSDEVRLETDVTVWKSAAAVLLAGHAFIGLPDLGPGDPVLE